VHSLLRQLGQPQPPEVDRTARWRLGSVLAASSPPKVLIASGIIVGFVELASHIASPLLVQRLIDNLGQSPTAATSILSQPLVWWLCGVLLVGTLAGVLSAFMLGIAGQRITLNLRSQLFMRIIHKEVAFFDASESGALASRLNNDTRPITELLTEGATNLVSGGLMLVASIAAIIWLDTRLALAIFAVVVLSFLAMAPMLASMMSIASNTNDITAALTTRFTRVFRQIRLVKAFSAERVEIADASQQLRNAFREGVRAVRVRAVLQPATNFALTTSILLVLVYGGMRVQTGTLSTGTLTALILYLVNLAAPLIQLSTFATQIQESRAAAMRLQPLLDMPSNSAERDKRPPVELTDMVPLEIRDLRFAYDGGEGRAGLQINHFSAPPDKITVITGASGSGKTTLFSLIQRFYAPQSGTITLGAHSIEDVSRLQWSGLIGFVPQQAELMSGTIADNVAYGSSDSPDMTELRVALSQAGCDDFVGQNGLSLDHEVGESGDKLSGGQRQRIAIARVFYRNPRIILLDEPVASLDGENEHHVWASIDRLASAGRIVIVATHRPVGLTSHRLIHYSIANGALTALHKATQAEDFV
jgi:ATP-binding cassette, subfamily B, bacterial AbcA/BmrA